MLLRPGGVPRAAIERVLGGVRLAKRRCRRGADEDEAPLAPGQLASHYAPRSRLRLDATSVAPGEALLAFGPRCRAGANPCARSTSRRAAT